ncbi:hypothetical protein B7494_g1303 [Chlorociboria aeruginascens]|nr:hypothetical protein B7494_g1303 [Chlorociboria aeruginascens]
MDRASQVLAQGVPIGVPNSYRALADHSDVSRSTLYHRARGRRSIEEKAQGQQYLKPWEEDVVVKFLLQMSNTGQPVRMKFIPSIAFIATRKRPVADRPLKPPGKNWAKALEKRHPVLLAKRLGAMDWNRHDKNIYWKVVHWFEVIGKILQDPAILAENVYNMDETGIMLSMPGSVKVLVGKDDKRKHRGARIKRTSVTSIECISADGRYLDPMIIWPASTHRSNWTTFYTPGWQYAYSDSGYTDSKISLEWLKRIFHPQTQERANKKPRVLICDGFGTHETLEILEFCFENNIILCRLPSHTSHKLQPCDVAVFSSLKDAYREQVDRLEQGGVNTIGKQHFTSLLSPAREKAFTPRNIKAGFAASGLYPFNPDRVLRHMPKPPADPDNLIVPRAEEANIGSCPQDEVPQTPVTPVSADGFMSLQNLIIKEVAHALDDTCKQKLERHVLKFTKAGQQGLVREALKDNRIELLNTINNEAKVRRSTKSLVLGKAKVMSYEDLEDTRAKRAEKEAAKEAAKEAKGKGKRGRKRKRTTPVADVSEAETDAPEPEPDEPEPDEPEPDEPEPSAKIMRMSKAPSRASEVQMSKVSARPSVVQMSGAPAGEAEMIPHL